MALIATIILAGITGWLAGKIMHFEVNIWLNVLLGIVGAIIGSIIAKFIGIKSSSLIGGMIISILGACLLVWLYRFIKN